MTIRCPQGRTWRSQLLPSLLTLPLLAGATGCAGTPWGETLSGSFPTPQEQGAAPQDERPPAPESVSGPSPTVPPPGASTGGAPPSPQRRGTPAPVPPKPGSPPSRPASPKPQASATPRLPSPYRVTIRLPQADPSAPAEAVTQALRAAGIPFEVETIERVKGAAAAPPPEAGQGSAAPPSVRPAPPPR